MIRYTNGNMLDADAEALVNTVNTVGVMGKGLALMFKQRFTQNMLAYADACAAGTVKTGVMFVTCPDELLGPKWIVNFPTKQHWRSDSRIEWVIDGLIDLRRFIVKNNVRSIAVPALGVGNGKLHWPAVREQIEKALGDLRGVDIQVFEPIRCEGNE